MVEISLTKEKETSRVLERQTNAKSWVGLVELKICGGNGVLEVSKLRHGWAEHFAQVSHCGTSQM